jgi:hypothetical protein
LQNLARPNAAFAEDLNSWDFHGIVLVQKK